MRRTSRAAARAAAAFCFFTTAGFAPTLASETDGAPVVSYAVHADTSLPADDLGLNDLTPPAAPADTQTEASTTVHEVAPVMPGPASEADEPADPAEASDARRGRTLAQLVSDFAASTTPDAETECLARAVYFESKGEPLAGQLSVAEVIINRSESRRFPSTICGVVRQPSQFSFVRRGYIPQPPQNAQWRTAVAIARIAIADLADGAAPRALFFHARYVRPGWRLTRVATVGNHVFYR